MTLGAWRRRDDPPTIAAMTAGIATDRRALWLGLTGWLRDAYALEGDMAWSDDDAGWVLRYRRNGRSLTTLMPDATGGFAALVVIGPSIVEVARSARLAETAREALETARPYADGRWLWLKVTDQQIVDDIRTLIALKSPLPGGRSAERAQRSETARELVAHG